MKGLARTLVFLGVVLLLTLAGGGFFAIQFLSTAPSTSNEPVVFEVQSGESFKTISHRLQEQGLVTSSWKLEIFARVTRSGGKVRVGEYALRRDFRPWEIMQVLVSGKSIEYSITISEGANRFEIGDILMKSHFIDRVEFMALTENPSFIEDTLGQPVSNLEGYLFPETYKVTKFTGARGLIRMMVERFNENYKRLHEVRGWSRGHLTDHQILTMASIIEKETGAPEERPVIASVFYNRLKIKMPLQTDPTIIYGLFLERGMWNGALPRGELRRPGPYNSYLNQGLPPGPISNPGFEALKAAGLPQKTDYLFFMSRNDGTHTFSREYGKHATAVREYWDGRKTGESKSSWRDLKNRAKAPDKVTE
jgi:UPF0755 protein